MDLSVIRNSLPLRRRFENVTFRTLTEAWMDASARQPKEVQDPEVDATDRSSNLPEGPVPLSLEAAFELFESLKPFAASFREAQPVVKLLAEIQQRDPQVALQLLRIARGAENIDEVAEDAIKDQLGTSFELLSFLHRDDTTKLVELGFALGILV